MLKRQIAIKLQNRKIRVISIPPSEREEAAGWYDSKQAEILKSEREQFIFQTYQQNKGCMASCGEFRNRFVISKSTLLTRKLNNKNYVQGARFKLTQEEGQKTKHVFYSLPWSNKTKVHLQFSKPDQKA